MKGERVSRRSSRGPIFQELVLHSLKLESSLSCHVDSKLSKYEGVAS
jgi:hypothetical protein